MGKMKDTVETWSNCSLLTRQENIKQSRKKYERYAKHYLHSSEHEALQLSDGAKPLSCSDSVFAERKKKTNIKIHHIDNSYRCPSSHKFLSQQRILLAYRKIGPIIHLWHIESSQEISGARCAFMRYKKEKGRK